VCVTDRNNPSKCEEDGVFRRAYKLTSQFYNIFKKEYLSD
jgi:hypothetical protein